MSTIVAIAVCAPGAVTITIAMTDLYLLEEDLGAAWFPFHHCRPVSELRAGAWLIRERWEAIADGGTQAIFAAPHLHGFAEDDVPPVTAVAPVGIDDLLLDDDPAHMGNQGAQAASLVNRLVDAIAVEKKQTAQ